MHRCLRTRLAPSTTTTLCRQISSPATRLSAAQAVQFKPPTPTIDDQRIPGLPRSRPDPFKITAAEVKELQQNLIRLLGSSHPSLHDIASYYFSIPGKQLRPVLVLLISRATNGLASGWQAKLESSENGQQRREDLDRPLFSSDFLTDWNSRMPETTESFSNAFSLPSTWTAPPPPPPSSISPWMDVDPHMTVLPTQTRLAQIAEMIHVASILHDDIVDNAPLRRVAMNNPAVFGSKLSVLGGDFLLARTSAVLPGLGEAEVVELISTVISNLIEGEVMQVRELGDSKQEIDRWSQYIRKTYYKTASLMAKSIRSAVVLGGARTGVQQDERLKDIAYAYGQNIGIAFQIVEDALDVSSQGMGMLGSGLDHTLGLATAPTLYALEEHPAMAPLIERRFSEAGDVETAREYVLQSQALSRTKALAQQYATKAKEILYLLPPSEARDALEGIGENLTSKIR